MTLDSIRPGTRYVIEAVDPAQPAVQRLMVLGLVEGAEVELASAGIGGDPMELLVFGASVCLRRENAERFRVRPLAAP